MIKLVAIALVLSLIIVYLRSINSEFSFIATVGAGILILVLIVDEFGETIIFISNLIELTNISPEIFKILFKITAVGYVVEFGAQTISDFGLTAISDKLLFAGKLIIFTMSMPIIYSLLNLLIGLLG